MLDFVVTERETERLIFRRDNIKIDTAARDFMIACALTLRTGKELEMAVRPHDPRKESHATRHR